MGGCVWCLGARGRTASSRALGGFRFGEQDIIAKQVEEHSAFELKTEYSKEKYMKRKEAKCVSRRRELCSPQTINQRAKPSRRYLQIFTPIEPTVHNIAEYNFEKQAPKVRDLRPDTLSQMMTYANVRPGGKLLVVEDLHGMVVAGAVERMGGTSFVVGPPKPSLHPLTSTRCPQGMVVS